jgi:hypothetical protein
MSAVQDFNPAVDILPDEKKLIRLIGDMSIQDELSVDEEQKLDLLDAFFAMDRKVWNFLIPLMGQEAYDKKMDEVEEYARQKRLEYIAKYGDLVL